MTPSARAVIVLAVLCTATAGCGTAAAPEHGRRATSGPVVAGAPTRPLHAPANYDPNVAGAVACSALILEGTVVRVVDGAPGRMRTTIDVSHWVKPATGPNRAVVDTADIAAGGLHQRWRPGQYLRLAVDVDPSVLPNWEFTAAQFARYEQAMADAASIDCPYGR